MGRLDGRQPVIARGGLARDRADRGHVGIFETASDGIGQELFDERPDELLLPELLQDGKMSLATCHRTKGRRRSTMVSRRVIGGANLD
jgi:hypothetical protein